MDVQVETLAEGLSHPQAPDILPNGDVVFASTYTETLEVFNKTDGVRTFAQIGGAPNAALLGSDDHVYFAQNGWTVGSWWAPNPLPPGIGRVKLDGSDPEMIFTLPDPIGLGAAHDMTWGADGKLYFTDSGAFMFGVVPPHVGYIYAISPDGSVEKLVACDHGYPAGIAAEKDGSIVWVEAYSLKLRRRKPNGSVETLTTFPDGEAPEGIKIDADGNFWIPFIGAEGIIRVVSPTGEIIDDLKIEGRLLNCVFGDGGLYVIDFGMIRQHPNTGGSLKFAHVGVEGQPLFRGAIEAGGSA